MALFAYQSSLVTGNLNLSSYHDKISLRLPRNRFKNFALFTLICGSSYTKCIELFNVAKKASSPLSTLVPSLIPFYHLKYVMNRIEWLSSLFENTLYIIAARCFQISNSLTVSERTCHYIISLPLKLLNR